MITLEVSEKDWEVILLGLGYASAAARQTEDRALSLTFYSTAKRLAAKHAEVEGAKAKKAAESN